MQQVVRVQCDWDQTLCSPVTDSTNFWVSLPNSSHTRVKVTGNSLSEYDGNLLQSVDFDEAQSVLHILPKENPEHMFHFVHATRTLELPIKPSCCAVIIMIALDKN